ncbi:MAG: MoaD/ThiS family protein [Acidobacteriota bacterium]
MVTIQLFATLRDLAGQPRIELELTERVTVKALFERLIQRWPRLKDYQPVLLIAVNEEYGQWESRVGPGDEVAFFPPVSGGGE